MESFPGPHNYMRPPLPPPPSMADPHLHSHHQPPPPPPQGSSWYPPQFQYHPSHSPSPPPPPPPPQQHWGHLPPPPSDHIHPPPPYASHPNPPYPPHPYPSQYPPPQRPQMPPPPPYSNSNQDWGNQNWVPHAGWEHHAHNNGEDWGAKARAWAAARNSVENQHPSVQPHYPSQYMPTSDSHYHGSEQTNVHSYQNFPAPAATVDKQHMVHQPEPAAVSSVHAYYAPDGNVPYARKDGNFSDTGTSYPRHDAFMSQSAHKQEVPSSYSSIPGGQVSIEQQPHGSDSGESMLADQTQFSYGNQSVAVSVDPCDQPLQFTPKFNHDNNPMMLAGSPNPADPAKFMDSATAVPTLQPWTLPAPPNISFPSVPPTFPSAAQMDPTISMPPHAGQLPPMLGRAPVPSFHSTVSSLSSSIGLGTGPSVHPTAAFPVDMYGTPVNSERPKKAAVPNWLRDEIIKKKDVIVSSGADHHQEESESIDDEPIDKSVGRSDQADSKSIDSSRSTEEEEEDEDYEEAARTAAINQEIKRVLTEVLLKVTSDLFDDIATRVLSEDDNSIEAKNDTNAQTQKLFPPPVASASKVSEQVLNPSKSKEPKSEDVTEKSSSGAAGDVLGLVNYESDDDEEVGSSAVTKSSKSNEITSSSNKEFAEVGNDTVETCNSPSDSVKLNKNLVNAGNSRSVASSRGIEHDHAFQLNDVDHRSDKNGVGPPLLTKPMERKTDAINDLGRVTDSFDDTRENSRKEAYEQEASAEILRKASKEDFQEKDTRRRDRHENRSSSARDSAKEAEIVEARENNKGEQSHGRHDERHQRKKNEDRSGSKERSKEQGVKYGEKTKEDSKKHSPHPRSKEITKEVERLKKASEKDDVHRKGERLKDEKGGDRSKHKHASDRGRHKRRRSSSVDSRGRNSKDNSVASYSDNSTDEASEKSRRKVHSKRRNLSPSPVRSRRRQVSQSPPSRKASQRRHSPYSSLEASRGRRSRSRSPAHRRR